MLCHFYGRFVQYFYLHYQVIPKIACVFLKPYKVIQYILIVCMQFNNYDKEKNIFEKQLKAIWQSHKSISGIAFEPETTGNIQCIQHVNIPTHPILAESDLYEGNPEVTTRFQSQASFFSHLYFEHLHVK